MEELQTLLDNYSNTLDLLSKSIKMSENKIAQVKKLSIEEIAQITYENTMKVFDIK